MQVKIKGFAVGYDVTQKKLWAGRRKVWNSLTCLVLDGKVSHFGSLSWLNTSKYIRSYFYWILYTINNNHLQYTLAGFSYISGLTPPPHLVFPLFHVYIFFSDLFFPLFIHLQTKLKVQSLVRLRQTTSETHRFFCSVSSLSFPPCHKTTEALTTR